MKWNVNIYSVGQGNFRKAVWGPYGGVLKVVETVVSQDEPSPLPRLNPTPWNTREDKKICLHMLICWVGNGNWKAFKICAMLQKADKNTICSLIQRWTCQ